MTLICQMIASELEALSNELERAWRKIEGE